jgi:23S rRNA (cytidine1920-2'-O)/16S rRNA (cytidine1409-2'-O)-methyltransferase
VVASLQRPVQRLDLELVRRGVCETRAKAQEAIVAGGVRVDGVVALKAAQPVSPDADIAIDPPHPWVSRGGVKLAAALEAFGVDPAGCVCLDIGSSTGGFTHILLHRGAEHVTAVDVGRDQMHARLRDDPRVTLLEGVDARALVPVRLLQPPDLVVCDASFIALSQILPTPLGLAARAADAVVLIKPQFEAGKDAPRNKRGLLADDHAIEVANSTARALDGLERFHLLGVIESPIRGGEGALEMLAHYRRG